MLSVFNKNYNGRSIRIREDKYVCLTDMASASGKLLSDWLETGSTINYIDALQGYTGSEYDEFVQSDDCGNVWGHPKLAIRFAQWCSELLGIELDADLDELWEKESYELGVLTASLMYRIDKPSRGKYDSIATMSEIYGSLPIPKKKSNVGFMYAVKLDGCIKIGFARCVEQRINQYRVSSLTVNLICAEPCILAQEQSYHKKYNNNSEKYPLSFASEVHNSIRTHLAIAGQ